MKQLIIGRLPGNDIVINDKYVSRRHCSLNIYDDGRVSIRDLGSKTGTYVNGKRITGEYFLEPHDRIRIGKTEIPWTKYVTPVSPGYAKTQIFSTAQPVKKSLFQRKKHFNPFTRPWVRNLMYAAGVIIILGALTYFVFFFHPTYTFDKNYSNMMGEAMEMVQTPDDGYAFVAQTNYEEDGNTKSRSVIVKIDKKGELIWEQNYPKNDSKLTKPYLENIALGNDKKSFLVGGTEYYFTDKTRTFVKAKKPVIFKLDENGKRIWKKNLPNITYGKVKKILPVKEGYLVAVEDFGNKPYLFKIKENANIVWKKKIGPSDFTPFNIIKLPHGKIMVVGGTDDDGGYAVLMDENGNKKWSKHYEKNSHAVLTGAAPTKEGYILAGIKNTNSNEAQGMVLFIQENGMIASKKFFGGDEDDEFVTIIPHGKGYVIGGNTESEGEGGSDAWFIKIDDKGNPIWEKTIGGENDDEINYMIKTSDGNFAACGVNGSKNEGDYNPWVIKLNKKGEINR